MSCLQWRKLLLVFIILCVVSLSSMLIHMCLLVECPYSRKLYNLNANSSAVRRLDTYRAKRNHTRFDINGDDVMVFLHIQKTGGTTFGRHLVRNIELDRPCLCNELKQKQCPCFRPNSNRIWQFSRYSTGWKCGLHADWTELHACVPKYMLKVEGKRPKRQFFYVTILREPVKRFLSEFYHVKRGATWKSALYLCNGRKPTAKELPSCYSGTNWTDVSLKEFISCPWNMAINRQTRMLADLRKVDCYNTKSMPQKKRNEIMLQSAKQNLRRMSYFGLLEFFKDSQMVFEETFGLRFVKQFEEYVEDMTHASGYSFDPSDNSTLKKIRQLNDLDIQLYEYAKSLFFHRVIYYRDIVKG